MRPNTVLALVAVLLCSACADQATTKANNNQQPQQFSAVSWDEAISPTQAARVSNGNLIFMR